MGSSVELQHPETSNISGAWIQEARPNHQKFHGCVLFAAFD